MIGTHVIILILLFFILLIFFFVVFNKKSSGSSKKESLSSESSEWPFYPKRVMSDPEQVLYWRLIEALPDRIVLCQVQLSRFLGVRRGHQRHWFNRINQKSADFVVCAKDSSVIAVIELDDATHLRESRKKADFDKSKAIENAGLRLIRWDVSAIPSTHQIRNTFKVTLEATSIDSPGTIKVT
ncbi:DUF2726 domain-containing protein [Xylella fastidiosa subsp. multiplex]|uniref:DUF2726 domain-containing protein n=1 Tax=Xylella fastidiosa subsp. multiplex TaxID=644357 RepID=A0A9Q4QTC3_XYLFS|nr:DUF2726 domain-containing protein [Xylella fastidiosa]ACA12017.1 conserved hypothetical protein [Xylella fastidiosa M12]MBE0269406.1 DUF2726 domain-containing protein [Xylella fastidiosa subsp. multiplex]MBE0274979.1 DUF2726 domain-containing protein [Xylella fastidiosa subsp. multiplex]MBE0277263.1 DUF2726 domain-containing protein [Xylella fastidiosa subsp. multiplex]MBE0282671.1 DUF2726 domain-containing protein [Xylella fastidiosa subsp. multiplex]